MINFLKQLPLFKEVYRQGGIDSFHLAHKDIMETMKDDLDKQAKELAEKKVSEMMSIVDWRKVATFSERQGLIYIGGIKCEAPQILALKAEAEQLKASEIWKLLYETPNALAQKTMFETGGDVDAFLKGRAMIYHLDSQKKIIDLFCSYQQIKK